MNRGVMDRISLKAYAKINIGLDIKEKREDGYHLLETVMQTVGVHDELLIRKTRAGIKIKTNKYFIPTDERNLAYKAARALIDKYDLDGGVRIDIGKNIPVGGGMAGGSTDAAGVIEGMDKLFALNMSPEEKDKVALTLGADVPFCLRRGTYLATGVGEELEKLNDMPGLFVLIYAPAFSVSTKWAYDEYDRLPEKSHPDIRKLKEAINGGDEKAIFANMGNSFEPVVEKAHPEIREVREMLVSSGAEAAMMSGSGSTVFGLFRKEADTEASKRTLEAMAGRKTVLLTTFIKGG